jgi:hypothetical protein
VRADRIDGARLDDKPRFSIKRGTAPAAATTSREIVASSRVLLRGNASRDFNLDTLTRVSS